jgi:hypothetical protein
MDYVLSCRYNLTYRKFMNSNTQLTFFANQLPLTEVSNVQNSARVALMSST